MTGPMWDAIAHLSLLLTSTLLAASLLLTFHALKRVEHLRKISVANIAFLTQSTSTKDDALTMTTYTCQYDGLADYLPLRALPLLLGHVRSTHELVEVLEKKDRGGS